MRKRIRVERHLPGSAPHAERMEVVDLEEERRARRSDPDTSHRAVQRLLGDNRLYEAIVREAAYAYDMGKPFRDSWMAARVRRDRNIVARMRLEVERDGWLERCGETADGHELLFRMRDAHRKMLDLLPKSDWIDKS